MQKVEALIFVIFDLIWVISNEIGRNYSFTGPGGLIIDSSRSGMCLSSCLASSIYFFYEKKVAFSWVQLPCSHSAHSLQLISGPCSIEIIYPCEWRIAIPASLMRVDQRSMCQRATSKVPHGHAPSIRSEARVLQKSQAVP